ncbi:DNA adenine methylase [Pseudomonas indica]|uniref:DNA adenine methylase n=1 Tax=Pseudomonas indica TaxID=137658 RepID=UPI0023F626CC|nr:DNA adenine methylase [Pseudomonas indica]MBU3059539.1 DNA adenine methylase [Pseudomonas indica]
MPSTHTPLRYPGGKSSITKMISEIISANSLKKGHYAEPYAGGCGLALSLLFKGYVHELHLNDLDKGIWAFWDCVLNDTQNFIEKIYQTSITIDEWHNQRSIHTSENVSDIDLGFSTFFLNRTNRSGIILKSGVIGGLKQDGPYKLDCRFNKDNLAKKIQRIAKYKHRIHFYNLDAINFIEKLDRGIPENSLFCIDPPYYDKGSTLYTNFYKHEDHVHISEAISKMNSRWILTYDNSPNIHGLYKSYRKYLFDLNYSAAQKRVGTELLVVSDNLLLPESLNVKSAA